MSTSEFAGSLKAAIVSLDYFYQSHVKSGEICSGFISHGATCYILVASQIEFYLAAVVILAVFALKGPKVTSLLARRILGRQRVTRIRKSRIFSTSSVNFSVSILIYKLWLRVQHYLHAALRAHQTTWVYIKSLRRNHRGGRRHHHHDEHHFRQKFKAGVSLYRRMPLKSMSRLWGKVNDLTLPVFLRSPMYRLYIWCFDCNLKEAAIQDLTHYKNLGEFFRRQLKPSCRPIDAQHALVSPSDGKVLHFGTVDRGVLEQVKGVSYSLEAFLGPKTWEDTSSDTRLKENINFNNNNNNAAKNSVDDDHVMKPDFLPLKEDYQKEIVTKPDTELFHCIIYLAPGDYHRFHSPADWTIHYRRHFPGELFSVNPGIARWIRGLFNLNERAVYYGQWKHGFMSMAAVGATNVGSIKVYCDQDLVTNCGQKWASGTFFDHSLTQSSASGIMFKRGENFGEFNLGSTLVMIFEAPKSFKFHIQSGQKVKFGQALGSTSDEMTMKK